MVISPGNTVIVLDETAARSLLNILSFVGEEIARRNALPAAPAGTALLDLYLSDLRDVRQDLAAEILV